MMLRHRRYDSVQEEVGAFDRYQITLLLVTQLANCAVAGSMLCTIYDMTPPTLVHCMDNYYSSSSTDQNQTITPSLCDCKNATFKIDFHSLLFDLYLYCSNDYIPTLMTSSVMAGGVVGAAVFGYFADRHGRKLLCIVALVGCGSANLSLYVASYHWISVMVAFMVLGLFGGGYMVVNSVLLMESVGGSRWRLLCACLNGWPFGMMFMALVGVLTKHWLWYHLSLAALAFFFALVFALFVHESPRWLLTRDKFLEAENILSKIARTNGRTLISMEKRDDDVRMTATKNNIQDTGESLERKLLDEGNLVHSNGNGNEPKNHTNGQIHESNGDALEFKYHPNGNNFEAKYHPNGDNFEAKNYSKGDAFDGATDNILRTYSYFDLLRHSFIVKRLSALTYCWLAASVVSYGLYFNLGSLAGDRYLNMFLTGLFKGSTGSLPYVLDRCGVGRKPVLVSSVVMTCCSCWAAVLFYYFHSTSAESSWFTTIFAIVGSSAIDPMWKINHLYSTELFPTVIRNMARAVCNVGSRFGSLIGPQVAYLNQIYFPSSFIVYGCVGVVHVFVAAFCLPETKGHPLVDRMPSKDEDTSVQLKILQVDS